MSVGTLGGTTCTRMRLQWPGWGAWWLDADVAEPVELAAGARVTAQISDLTLQGTVVNGYARNGVAGYRVVGGAGGWGKPLPALSYQNDAGVKLATVVGDVATAVGETVSGLPTTKLAEYFARFVGSATRPASWILNYYFPRGWHVAPGGTTVVGAYPSATYAGDGARVRIEPMANVVDLDIETVDNIAPGIVVDGADPATDIELLLDKKLTARVYSGRGSASSRRLDAWAKLFSALFPDVLYRGAYEFRVSSQNGERFNLEPFPTSLGFDSLENVPVRGPAGIRATVTVGELALVTFVNAQPDRPAIISHDDPEAPGFVPSEIDVGNQNGALDFLATKSALDAVQAKLDDLISKYNTATYPTGVGPSGTTSAPETPVGSQPHTDILKASHS